MVKILLFLIIIPTGEPPSPKIPEPVYKEKSAKVIITKNSKIYLDGRPVCWPLPHSNVETKRLVIDDRTGRNVVDEVWFETLPPPGYQKMPKEQEKGKR